MNPWPALIQFPGPSALPPVWRKYLGEAFEPFTTAFLDPKPKPVVMIRCPRRCGCDHFVLPEQDGSFVGLCHCEPPACPTLRLSLADVIALKLSWPKLGRALCLALQLDYKPSTLNLYSTQQIGSWSADAIPAFLSIHYHQDDFRAEATDLIAQLAQPFILLLPTTLFLDAHIQGLLARIRAAFFSLETTVRLTEQGTLLPLKAPGELFAQFRPEPKESVAEETARQVWALARELDAGSALRKAPPLRVFLLYCRDGLSAGQIARQCGCSRPLVFARLKWLRSKLGRNLEELRQYSEHFERMEDSLSDARARRIYRKGAAFGEGEEGDG